MCQRRLALVASALLCACTQAPADDPAIATAAPPRTPAPGATTVPATPTSMPAVPPLPASDAVPGFVDATWRVEPRSGVEAGTTYTFRRDGTLAIDAPHGTPSEGAWHYAGGKLTMVEEGIAHPTDILVLDAGHLVLRSHHPGGSVDIAMVRATPSSLP